MVNSSVPRGELINPGCRESALHPLSWVMSISSSFQFAATQRLEGYRGPSSIARAAMFSRAQLHLERRWRLHLGIARSTLSLEESRTVLKTQGGALPDAGDGLNSLEVVPRLLALVPEDQADCVPCRPGYRAKCWISAGMLDFRSPGASESAENPGNLSALGRTVLEPESSDQPLRPSLRCDRESVAGSAHRWLGQNRTRWRSQAASHSSSTSPAATINTASSALSTSGGSGSHDPSLRSMNSSSAAQAARLLPSGKG